MRLGKTEIKCQICSMNIDGFKYEPMPQWNISGLLCGKCYSKKISEHYLGQQTASSNMNNQSKISKN